MVWGGVIYFMLLKVSVDTLKHFALRVSRLYEQGADIVRIREYVRHWYRWVRFGLRCCVNKVGSAGGYFSCTPFFSVFSPILLLNHYHKDNFK